MKSFKEFINEDGVAAIGGVAPTNTVAGVAGSGDSRLPADQREPGVSKKHNPVMSKILKRKAPKI